MKDGINIDSESAEKQMIPEDLNSLAVGSYKIPNPVVRNRYLYIFLFLSLLSLILSYFSNWINLYPAFILLLFLSIFVKFIENRNLIYQNEVIEFVSSNIPHSIGYYSIALTFDFKFNIRLLNPIWTVIIYDHNNPPKQKSIIEVDAYSKEIISDVYTEDVIDA